MPTLIDYMDLRAEVIRLLNTPAAVDNLDAYTASAERWLSNNLRHRKQIVSNSVSFSSGRAALPAGFIEMLNVFGPGGWTYIQAPLDVVERPQSGGSRILVGGSKSGFLLVGGETPVSATGATFAIDANDIVISGVEGPIRIQYFTSIPTITSALTASNWLLTMHPDLYAYSVAYEASQGNVSPDRTDMFMQMRDRLLNEARVQNERAQYGAGRVRHGGVVA
jgi:hypothetical protein